MTQIPASDARPVLVVTGAAGLLGSAVCRIAAGRFRTIGIVWNRTPVVKSIETLRMDLSDAAATKTIAALKPAAIVHCAAMTDLDGCEARPQEAFRHNVTATRRVAEAARAAGAYLIHISTDGLFAGDRGGYKESDAPAPVSVYAKTKLESERVALEAAPGALVARTTIYGWNAVDKKSLAEWVLDRLRSGADVPGFEDAVFSPIFTDDLAEALLTSVRIRPAGLLHVGGSEHCNKYEFARQIAEVFGFDPNRVRVTKLAQAGLKAPRALNVWLDVSLAEKVLGLNLPGVKSGLARFKATEPVR